jgi:hypothetical protein
VQHPGEGVIGNAPHPAGSRQLSESRFQSELKELASAQRNGMAIDAVTPGGSAIRHAARQIQQYSRVQHFSLLSTPRPPQILQSQLLFSGKSDVLPLRREWHKPFSHEMLLRYSYQQNDDLVGCKSPSQPDGGEG